MSEAYPILNFPSVPYGVEDSWHLPEPLHYEALFDTSSAYSWDIAPHRHGSLFQLFLVMKGEVFVIIDGEEQLCRAPALIFVPPLTVHGFRYEAGSDGHVLTILESAFLEILNQTKGLLTRLKNPFILSLEPGDSTVCMLNTTFETLAEEYHNSYEGRMQMLYSHAANLLIQTARLGKDNFSPSGEAANDKDQRLARRFTEMIDKHFQEHRSNDFYASSLGLSDTKLTRVSNAVLGMSPQKVLTGRLMLEAQRNLLYTNLSCAQIAFKLGFEDPAYFNRFFKKYTSKTPLQFRKASTQRLNPPRL